MTVLSKTDRPISADQLIAIHHTMVMHDDSANAKKISELYQKMQENEYIISFAGHFSAGKSSMINALLNRDILPKSPIPTSANIVRISSGRGTARIYFQQEEPVEYVEPYDIDMIKEYCKDKDTIKRIDISLKDEIIPAGKMIIDTPGIDAADDADRLITESSLHLVDALFYVMDYNHVQSEVNLLFLKQIEAMKLPYYIIINQIDKHQENELTFADFRNSISETFKEWKLHPRETFYTSLLEESNVHNQFAKVQQEIKNLLGQTQVITARITDAAGEIMDAHKAFLREVSADKRNGRMDIDLSTATAKRTELTDRLHMLLDQPAAMKKACLDELNQTLKNAYLMPASLRDKAALFLKTQQSDFKVGFFSSYKKTQAVKEKALQEFLAPLQDIISSTVQWKLRDKMLELLQKYNMHDEHMQQQIQDLHLNYEAIDLQEQMKPGAKLNGNYLLHFTNDIAADIKAKYKQLTIPLIDEISGLTKKQLSSEVEKLEKQQTDAEIELTAASEQEQAQSQLKNQFHELQESIDHPVVSDIAKAKMMEQIEKQMQSVKKAKIIDTAVETGEKRTIPAAEDKPVVADPLSDNYTTADVLENLQLTIDIVSGIPGFQSMIKDLQLKKARLQNRSVTIALFGAFSAGKSTFANALIGKDLLPSSPNPTTAAISRIMAPTPKHAHKTSVIHFKKEEALLADLQKMLEILYPPEISSFQVLLEWGQKHALNMNNGLTKLQEGYLHALLNGFTAIKDKMGKTITVSFDQFQHYAANETISCYVEQIDLYYDCALTKQGIQLVDTPGADSMNARHTNVAFDYIKYADAIIYVTYYNHALSRADRDFLMQLGRIKEAFELDKMFFMINASDLAANREEKNMVVQYVKDQLTQLGIRFPRIFPVSSRQVLEKKTAEKPVTKEMLDFEEAFFRFVHHDLAGILIQGALFDMNRVQHTMDSLVNAARMDENEKKNHREQLLKNQEKMEQAVSNTDPRTYTNRVSQKIEKQLFYIKQRFDIRFTDMFKEIFNPTTITEQGKAGKQEIRQAMDRLLDYAGYELLQEVRAASLRVEKYMQDTVKEYSAGIREKVGTVDDQVSLSDVDKHDFQTPELKQPLTSLSEADFQEATAMYKGTKSFFVQKEKEKMKTCISKLLDNPIDRYLQHEQQELTVDYSGQLENVLHECKHQFIEEIASFVDSSLSAMAGEMDQKTLLDKQRALKHTIDWRQ